MTNPAVWCLFVALLAPGPSLPSCYLSDLL
jgi:hypothetical protein